MATIRPNKRILILCEGETEYFYAKALQSTLPRDKQRGLSIDTFINKPNDPKSLAQEAKKRVISARRERNAYSEVWVFFDNDNWPQLNDAFEIIRKEQFRYAYCSICFEHWFILHFEFCGRTFANGDQAITYLKRLWPEYHKTKLKHFEILKESLPEAMQRAKTIRKNSDPDRGIHLKNPYVTIDYLIEFFEELKK
jgi:hypothetical protein